MEKFTLPTTNWENIPLENALFILNEGKDIINGLAERSNRITERAFSIINLLIPIILALIGISFNASIKSSLPGVIFLGLITAICSLILVVVKLGNIITPRLYHMSGREPKEISTNKLLGLSENPQNSYLALILIEIEHTQEKIEYNKNVNVSRSKTLKECIRIVAATLSAATILLLIYHIYSM